MRHDCQHLTPLCPAAPFQTSYVRWTQMKAGFAGRSSVAVAGVTGAPPSAASDGDKFIDEDDEDDEEEEQPSTSYSSSSSGGSRDLRGGSLDDEDLMIPRHHMTAAAARGLGMSSAALACAVQQRMRPLGSGLRLQQAAPGAVGGSSLEGTSPTLTSPSPSPYGRSVPMILACSVGATMPSMAQRRGPTLSSGVQAPQA